MLNKVINAVKSFLNIPTHAQSLPDDTQAQIDQWRLSKIKQKAEDHLQARRDAGLPPHGKAEFKPGHIISTKFWGSATQPQNVSRPENNLNMIEYTPLKAPEQPKAVTQKTDDSPNLAGYSLHFLKDSFTKVMDKLGDAADSAYQVITLDIENQSADIETSDGSLPSFTKPAQLSFQRLAY